jgi:hypothetical protein
MSTTTVSALLRQQVDRWAERRLKTKFTRLLELRAQDPGPFNYPISVFSEWRGKAFYLDVRYRARSRTAHRLPWTDSGGLLSGTRGERGVLADDLTEFKSWYGSRRRRRRRVPWNGSRRTRGESCFPQLLSKPRTRSSSNPILPETWRSASSG